MQRYDEHAEIILASQGKRRYSTMYYPTFPRKTSDTYIISKRSDRLDNLAYTYYQDPRFYWIIQRSNSLPQGSFMIPPGTRLRIPNVTADEIRDLINERQF